MDSTTTISENSTTTMNKPEPFKKTGLGARFKSAREAMQLSEKEVAARLHLSMTIISLIEDENFTDGPPATFMRGYLRSYAKLLNLPASEIASTLKELENAIPSSISIATPVMPLKTPRDNNERYLRGLTYVIVLVLIILVSVWWSSHSRYVIADVPPAHPATDEKATTITSTPEPTVAIPATAVPAQAAPQTATPPAATQQPAAATPATTTTAPVTPVATSTTPETNTATTTTTVPAAVTPPTIITTTTNAPTTTTTETPPAPASETPKPSSISKLKMAVPEPDVDN